MASKYPQTRAELTREVIARKQRMFGGGDRPFNQARSAMNVIKGMKNSETGRRKAPTMALLNWAANVATDGEIMALLGNQAPDLGFLYYK